MAFNEPDTAQLAELFDWLPFLGVLDLCENDLDDMTLLGSAMYPLSKLSMFLTWLQPV